MRRSRSRRSILSRSFSRADVAAFLEVHGSAHVDGEEQITAPDRGLTFGFTEDEEDEHIEVLEYVIVETRAVLTNRPL